MLIGPKECAFSWRYCAKLKFGYCCGKLFCVRCDLQRCVFWSVPLRLCCSLGKLICELPIWKFVRDWNFLLQQVLYGVISPEGYYKVCVWMHSDTDLIIAYDEYAATVAVCCDTQLPPPLATNQQCKTYQPPQTNGTLSIQPTEMANTMLSQTNKIIRIWV
jgi:hypothetical protein